MSFIVTGAELSTVVALKISTNFILDAVFYFHKNDPSAGSPTDTVLRLLHPLDDKAHNDSSIDR